MSGIEAMIRQAIADRRTLEFTYNGTRRIVEPHILGYDRSGDLTLSAWQRSGGSGQGFRDFHVSKLSAPATGQEIFAGPRPGYNRFDTTMPRVLVRL